MAISITRKFLPFRYLGPDLVLSVPNAPWLSNVLKIVGYTAPDGAGLNNQATYAGTFGGQTGGGTLTQLVQNADYLLISGNTNGWSLPDAIEVFNLPGLTAEVWDTGIIGGQSNDSGRADLRDFPPSVFGGQFPLTPIWNDDTRHEEPLELGVNECGLNGNGGYPEPPGTRPGNYPYVRSDGVTIPLALADTYDGTGPVAQYAVRHKADHAADGKKLHLLMQNVNHPTNTDGASIQRWMDEILASLAGQKQRYSDYAATKGATLKVRWWHFGTKEAMGGTTTYGPQMLALRDKAIQLGVCDEDTHWFLPLAPQPAIADVRAQQQALANQYPDIFTAYSFSPTYQPDNVHFDQPGQVEQGNALYNAVNNTTTPPVSGGGGSGGVGTFPLQSGYDGRNKLTVVATGAATSTVGGFTMFNKVTPKFLGSSFGPEYYIYSAGDLASAGTNDESVAVEILANGQVRVRVKLTSGVDTSNILKGQGGTPIILAANSIYRTATTVAQPTGQVVVTVYIEGVAYPFTYTGTLNHPSSPVTYGGILVNGSASAFPFSLIGDQAQLGFINRALSASEVQALTAADLVMTKAQYEAADVAVYSLGLTETATSGMAENLADLDHPLMVVRYSS